MGVFVVGCFKFWYFWVWGEVKRRREDEETCEGVCEGDGID